MRTFNLKLIVDKYSLLKLKPVALSTLFDSE